jgi:hypothetical protein
LLKHTPVVQKSMQKKPPFLEHLLQFERPPWNRKWVALTLAVIIAIFDFFTGPYIQFPILFTFPVMLMAWNSGFKWSASLALALCTIRFAFQYLWNFPFSFEVAVMNGALRLTMLALLAAMTARSAQNSRTLRARVNLLEGILPICGFCKDIRNPSGEWQKIESYVSAHSDARFSHGFCPDCGIKHYGEYYQNSGD